MRVLLHCSAHPAMGGPHRAPHLFVAWYHGARIVMCTHRSKRGTVCGALTLDLTGVNDE